MGVVISGRNRRHRRPGRRSSSVFTSALRSPPEARMMASATFALRYLRSMSTSATPSAGAPSTSAAITSARLSASRSKALKCILQQRSGVDKWIDRCFCPSHRRPHQPLGDYALAKHGQGGASVSYAALPYLLRRPDGALSPSCYVHLSPSAALALAGSEGVPGELFASCCRSCPAQGVARRP